MVGQPRWNSALGVWEGNAALGTTAVPSPLWIFGYGSLCWKADFPAEEQFVGRVSGYRRYFCQRSCDHRGTPEQPGLVATLLSDAECPASTCAAAAAAAFLADGGSAQVAPEAGAGGGEDDDLDDF